MCNCKWVALAACTAAVTLGGMKLFADDKGTAPATQPAMAGGKMDQAAMMEAWMKYATPGPEQAALAKGVGEWKTEMEDLTIPGSGKSAGTAKVTMVMGGRYLMEEAEGTSMGQSFTGMLLLGYDNIAKRYDSTWVDSMGTGIMMSHGKMTDGKLELIGDMSNPMMPDAPMHTRSVTTVMGPDKHMMEMYMPGPDGKEMCAFRITYTRVK